MVGREHTRILFLVTLLRLGFQVSSDGSSEGTEGFGQVEDCRFLTYEQQQFYDLKLPSFRTDWISPDFIQSALPHTPAKVRRATPLHASLCGAHELAAMMPVIDGDGWCRPGLG